MSKPRSADTKASMKTIALEAGVSVVTVSRALKNNPCIPIQTRERIQQIAQIQGYRTNPMVAALMAQLRSSRTSQSEPVIAFIFSHPFPERYSQPESWLGAIFSGADARAEELGYKLEKFRLNDPGMSEDRMRRLLQARGISAAIMAPLVEPIPQIRFNWDGFSCATVGYSYNAALLHRSVNDQFSTIRMAIQNLIGLGYKRIGLAIRYEDDNRTENKWAGGFLSIHPYLPVDLRLPPFFWHDGHPEGFPEWVATYQPDAIITLHPIIKEWLLNIGKSVPLDIGLVSLNLQYDQANWTGINQRHDLLGAIAVDLVAEQLYRNEHGCPTRPKTVMQSGDWQVGSTTRMQIKNPHASSLEQVRITVPSFLQTGK